MDRRYTSVWYSDDFARRSNLERLNSGDSSDVDRDSGILGESFRKTKTPRKFATADFVDLLNVSSYSPSSDTAHGCAMSDTTPESADDTDSGCGVTAGIGESSQADLRMRVRRFDEENSLLREDLGRAEELTVRLQRQLENLRLKLDQTKEKCRQLEHENDEHQELLHEAEQKARDNRWALHKLEKEKNILARKLEDAEAEKQQIALLNSKLEKCKKEKYEYIREVTLRKRELEEKQRDCELLKDQIGQLTETNKNLQESYDKSVQRLRDKIQNLKKSKFDPLAPDSAESSSDGTDLFTQITSTTPIGYLQSYAHGTSYTDNQLHNSLYDELKASGFSTATESRLRELENELSWYEEENDQAVTEINKFLDQLRDKQLTPNVADLNNKKANADENSEVSLLLRKIWEISEMVNKILRRPEVKEASTQCRADSTYTNQQLASQFRIRSFEDHLRFMTENKTESLGVPNSQRDVFIEAFSMNSRSPSKFVGDVAVESEATNLGKDNDSMTRKIAMPTGITIPEHTIIEPIVKELDRIIQCTNGPGEESAVRYAALKNPRYRCIYTSVDDSAVETKRNWSENPNDNLGSVYGLSSGGDGSFPETMRTVGAKIANAATSTDETQPIVLDYSNDFGTNPHIPKRESSDGEASVRNDASILEDYSHESALHDTKSNLIADSSPTLSKTSERPATPRRMENNYFEQNNFSPNVEGASDSRKPSADSPKRKISVFHRSFDIDTLDDDSRTDIGSNTYRVTERSKSTPSPQRENSFDNGSKPNASESTKIFHNPRYNLLNYREKGEDSDSSENQSPKKKLDHREDSTPPENLLSRTISRPVILAPTKLKLPSLMEIPSYESIAKKNSERNDDRTSIAKLKARLDARPYGDGDDETRLDEPRRINDKFNVNDVSNLADTSDSPVRSSDYEIQRGVTYRQSTFSRELNFSDYSLLSTVPGDTSNAENQITEEIPESVSEIDSFSNDETASYDPSPKCQFPLAEITSKFSFLTTYEKPQIHDRTYARQDPPKSRGLYDRTVEAGCRYEAGNESTRSVGSYGGVAGTVIREGQDEKTNVSSAVALAMSSGEESSDSECDPMAIRDHDNVRRNVVNETRSISPTVLNFGDGALLGTSTPAPTNNNNNNNNNNCCNNNNNIFKRTDDLSANRVPEKSVALQREKREKPHTIRRSLSDGGCGRFEYPSRSTNRISSQEEFNKEESRPAVFPSLTDVRLQESGIAKILNNDELRGNIPEAELERKYIALSVGLVTDRVTLPRRVALSLRQRDHSERNLSCEVQKMQQDIQDLAPLCIDRESVERVERVRHQLEMINQCAHRVSCTAETLGAVHQENRVSRAILLADRYLLVLRSRCEKLAHDLSETKRILMENNIVIEEHNGELGDDTPRTRYRGVPITNRTMMARRRASIATIFRPLGNFHEVTKDGLRQRNSVSGRVSLRRPSLTAECQKWESEKLDRTDSSSSTGELREIFEQAESRRSSREENNNVLRLHSSSLSFRECDNSELEVWVNASEDPRLDVSPILEGPHESGQMRTSLADWFTVNHTPWKTMLWCMIISFFFGFYVKHVVSLVNGCSGSHFKWWSIEEILTRYLPVDNDAQRPI